jgi:hypothetical protein
LVRSFAILAVLVVSGLVASTPAQIKVRRNVKDLSKDERQLVVDAFLAMKKAPKKGTDAVAQGRYDEYVLVHGNTGRIHMNSTFLPWHRKMLCEFEMEVEKLDPKKFKGFTLPYWDWTVDNFPRHLKDADADDNFMGPKGDGPKGEVTKGPFKQGDWVTVEDITGAVKGALVRDLVDDLKDLRTDGPMAFKDATTAANFKDMSEMVEMGKGMHNSAHALTGGTGQISDPLSGADDPAFFLLHAFTDLAWMKWQVDNNKMTAYTQFGTGAALGAAMPAFGSSTKYGFDKTMHNKISENLNPFKMTDCTYTYEYDGKQFVEPVPEPATALALLCALPWLRKQRRSR